MEEPRSPSLAHVIRKAIEAHLSQLRVGLPGRIERYDPETRKADVKPLVRDVYFDIDGKRQAAPLPVITDVPVLFPGGGGFWLTFPVKAGDTCELRFADSSLDRWKVLGGEVDPVEIRPHDLSNAVALVGLQSFAEAMPAHAENVVLGASSGARVELTPEGEVIVNGGTKSVARVGDAVGIGGAAAPPSGMAGWIAQVTTALNALAPGSVTVAPTEVGSITQGADKVKVKA